MPNSVTSLNRRPVFKWVIWLGVAPTTDAKKTCSKEIGLCAQNMTTILGSIVNIIVGGSICPLDERENFHFDNA